MFDIGFWEIMVITLVALLVVGPERLPGLARELGRFVGKARRFVNSVRSDIEQELQTEELRKMLKTQEDEIQQLKTIMRDTEGQLREEIESVSQPLQTDIEETKKTLQLEGDPFAAEAPPREAERARDKPADPKQSWDRPSVVPRVPVNGLLGENLETEHSVPPGSGSSPAPSAPAPAQPTPSARASAPAQGLSGSVAKAEGLPVEAPEIQKQEPPPELSVHEDYRSDAAQWGDIAPPSAKPAQGAETREKG